MAYLRRGIAITLPQLRVHLLILAVYATPALLAAYLAATVRRPNVYEHVAVLALPWVTAVAGTVVVMIAVGHQAHGRPTGLLRASLTAFPWLPRYVWTNMHTSVVFWVPVGLLLQARGWQRALAPLEGWLLPATDLLWWLAIGAVGLLMHTRTLLAPFLAVHGDLPGTMAALEAWRLSGRHFVVCLSTLVVAGLPVALPLGCLALTLVLTLPAAALAAFSAALPNLVWAAIQAVRPVLIPALYELYNDLWAAERVRRRREGEPRVPAFARVLLALTRPLPHLGRLSGP